MDNEFDEIEDIEPLNLKDAVGEQYEKELAPIEAEDEHLPTVQDADEQAARDMDEAVANLKEMVNDMSPVLKAAALFAQASEKGNAYESVAAIMKALIDANKTIVDIHNNKKKLQLDERKSNSNSPEIQNNTQNNNHFYGADDIENMLKNPDAISILTKMKEIKDLSNGNDSTGTTVSTGTGED